MKIFWFVVLFLPLSSNFLSTSSWAICGCSHLLSAGKKRDLWSTSPASHPYKMKPFLIFQEISYFIVYIIQCFPVNNHLVNWISHHSAYCLWNYGAYFLAMSNLIEKFCWFVPIFIESLPRNLPPMPWSEQPLQSPCLMQASRYFNLGFSPCNYDETIRTFNFQLFISSYKINAGPVSHPYLRCGLDLAAVKNPFLSELSDLCPPLLKYFRTAGKCDFCIILQSTKGNIWNCHSHKHLPGPDICSTALGFAWSGFNVHLGLRDNSQILPC